MLKVGDSVRWHHYKEIYTVVVAEPDRNDCVLLQSRGGFYILQHAQELMLAPRQFKFGAIFLEETGECRKVKMGDFSLEDKEDNTCHAWDSEEESQGTYPILKPVELVNA